MYPPPYNGGYYTPWLWVDGRHRGSTYSQWAGYVAPRVTTPTPVNIGIFGAYEPGSRTGTVQAVIQNDSSAAITARVSVVITEDSCNYTGPNGDAWHNHVCRDYIPDQNGTVVTIPAGAADTVEQPFALDPGWNEARCRLVVYAQSTTMVPADSSYPAFQGASENVMAMVGIEEAGRRMPELFELRAAPNPCRSRTGISFSAAAGTPYWLGIYTADGSRVRGLRGIASGATSLACDLGGVPKGVYLCRLSTPAGAAVARLVRVD
ncbi:Omp28-related outer membrane protein [candidate division WOR-3 bacterium]|nr:Omp28-related outer membrane protein [candidate division WOR-3 bacterium]